MATAPIPDSEPSQFAAGDSLSWTKSLADYQPTDGWSLLYCFRGGGQTLDVNSTVLNSAHLISLSTTQTAKLLAGIYAVSGYALNAGQRVQIFSASITVTANLQAAPGDFEIRTPEKITLDNINAVIQGRATSSILKSTVEGTMIERIPFAQLMELQALYQVKVRNQEIKLLQAQGKPTGRTIFASFTRPRFDGYTGQL